MAEQTFSVDAILDELNKRVTNLMSNELKIFENPAFGSIRTVEVDGTPYFVGKDVAEVLGYTNTPKAIRDHVDEEDKLTEQIVLSGQGRDTILINESGLYSLILSSKLPKAKEFKHWVTSEVLPAIRQHGMYATEELLADPDLAIKAFTALKEERAKREALEKMAAAIPSALDGGLRLPKA